MTRFADVLEEFLASPGEAPASASFEQSVRAFEAALGQLTSETGETAACAKWADALGITFPCSASEIKKAFRRLAFATHPDRPGGSHGAFLRAQAAMEEALASLQATRPENARARQYARRAVYIPARTSTQSTYA